MSVLESPGSVVGLNPIGGGERLGCAGVDRPIGLRSVVPAVFAVLLSFAVALIVYRLDGHFGYTLDDPYIHLALADQIAAGHYGLAASVPAAPSSSILFPFLLAAASFTRLGSFAPLLLNGLAVLASGWLLALVIEEVFPDARLRLGAALVLATAFALGFNLVGLALTGMEHALHVAVTLAWGLGALRFLRRGALAPWWWASALAEPLIRYEGGVLWLATVLLLATHRRRAAALWLLAAGIGLLGTFSAFLYGLGLPLLPSSVMVKTQLTNLGDAIPDLGPLGRLLYTVTANLATPNALPLLGAILLLALAVERRRRADQERDRSLVHLALIGLAATSAQLIFGRVDVHARYTAYVLALDATVLAAAFAAEIERWVPRLPWWGWAAVLSLVAVNAPNYVARSLRPDLGAADIYDQQYQMHRMAADFYRAPVAVNDLGWVSYRNPYPVLDLWGLGSEEARLARAADPSGRWMDDLTTRHGVGLVMIYDRWFPARPANWLAVARLSLPSEPWTAGGRTVTFYATGPDRVPAIEKALDRLARDLPADVRLDRVDAESPAADRYP